MFHRDTLNCFIGICSTVTSQCIPVFSRDTFNCFIGICSTVTSESIPVFNRDTFSCCIGICLRHAMIQAVELGPYFLKAVTFNSSLLLTSDTKFTACKPLTFYCFEELLVVDALSLQFWCARGRWSHFLPNKGRGLKSSFLRTTSQAPFPPHLFSTPLLSSNSSCTPILFPKCQFTPHSGCPFTAALGFPPNNAISSSLFLMQ